MKYAFWSCFLMVLVNHSIFAKPLYTCNGTDTAPCIVKDAENTKTLKYWREMQLIKQRYRGNTTGLENVWVSGSEVPSELGFQTIIDNVKKSTNNQVEIIIDVDLRKESHGFLNGAPINLTTLYNWINRDKTNAESQSNESTWLKTLASKPYIENVLTNQQFDDKDWDHGVTIKMISVEDEETLVKKFPLIKYDRFYVNDHMAPSQSEADAFVQFVKTLPPNTWIHFHCRGGKGRTTTFLAMYDMLRNANQVSFDDIIKRQASIFPYYDLSDVDHGDPNLRIYYKQRFDFLKQFYIFAQNELRNNRTPKTLLR